MNRFVQASAFVLVFVAGVTGTTVFAGELGGGLRINEVVIDHAGVFNDHQFIELSGTAAMDYSEYTVVVIDGDAGTVGRIDQAYTVGFANGEGFWTTGFLSSGDILDIGSCTVLLVTGFDGREGLDLDSDDDGTLDRIPWTATADSVSISDGDPGDFAYSTTVIDAAIDGLGTVPGGISRIPGYFVSRSGLNWMRNDFDGEGLGIGGSITSGEAYNTPGALNTITRGDYYAGVTATSQAGLRSDLHALIDDHQFYPYSSGGTDTWDILEEKQADPNNASNAVDIYKNETFFASGGFDGNHDREHSWPKALGVGSNSSDYQYTDCHHLFLSYNVYNSSRGSFPFGDCVSGCGTFATDDYNGVGGAADPNLRGTGGAGDTVWQVWSHRKGDIARAAFYMDVRYEGGTHGVTGRSEPDLILSETSGGTNMGHLSQLLIWHVEDPVDAEEQAGNDVVYSYQGNRNPFIDHPEWVACVFGGACGGLFNDGFESGGLTEWSQTSP